MQRLRLGATFQNLEHLKRLAYSAGKVSVFLGFCPSWPGHPPPSEFRNVFSHLAVNLSILGD
jgi:hypothetical protein